MTAQIPEIPETDQSEPDLNTWLTDDIRDLLKAIAKPHAPKKRTTVMKLAYARANEIPVKTVFNQPDTCNETIWYTKWQHIPEVRAAFEACYNRLLEWADEQTAAMQAHYRRKRLQAIARFAADAPSALAEVMTGGQYKGSEKISAANALLTWADPEAAGKAQPAPPPAETSLMAVFGQMPVDELDQVIDNLQVANDASLNHGES